MTDSTQPQLFTPRRVVRGVLAMGLLAAASLSQAQFQNQLKGDVGAAAFGTASVVRGDSNQALLLPYGYFDYNRFFMRVDTLGVKTLPIGNGHLELVGRLSFEGFKANTALPGVRERRNPLPIGVGTFQAFDWGAVFLNAFYNTQSQHGALLEATYAGRVQAGPLTLYPLLSLEHRTAGYVRGLYGVDAVEAGALGTKAYSPGASTVPVLGLSAHLPLSGNWGLTANLRHRRLDSAIRNSPIVDRAVQNTGYVGLVYSFK